MIQLKISNIFSTTDEKPALLTACNQREKNITSKRILKVDKDQNLKVQKEEVQKQ